MKGSSFIYFGNGEYFAMMVFNYFFTQCKANSRPGVCFLMIEALKKIEYLGGVLFFKSNPIISNYYFMIHQSLIQKGMFVHIIFFQEAGGNMDFRRHPRPGEFQGIADQVMKQLVHLDGNSLYYRQFFDG